MCVCVHVSECERQGKEREKAMERIPEPIVHRTLRLLAIVGAAGGLGSDRGRGSRGGGGGVGVLGVGSNVEVGGLCIANEETLRKLERKERRTRRRRKTETKKKKKKRLGVSGEISHQRTSRTQIAPERSF